MIKILLIFLTIITVAVLAYNPVKEFIDSQPSSTKPVTLTFWGVNESESVIQKAISKYKETHPNVTINFVNQSLQNYRTRVVSQIIQNTGPDIFMIHNTWLSMFLQLKVLQEMPSKTMTSKQFNQDFYPVASKTLMVNGKIYALPREIDGLALFYNQDTLQSKGLQLPKTWEQLTNTAKQTLDGDEKGNLTHFGVALGTADNVDYWPDIIGLLFSQQPNADLASPANAEGTGVFRFYSSFVTDSSKHVWDSNAEASTVAFAKGDLTFLLAPASKISQIKALNPNLHFATTPVPQTPESNIGWATFWAYSVSAKSKHPSETWEFLKFLTSMETEKLLNQEAIVQGVVPKPYSRVDLQREQESDPLMGAFVKQGPIYTSWYLSSGTQDKGINDEIIKLYQEPVNVTLRGGNPLDSLKKAQSQIPGIIAKYTIPAKK